MEEQNNDFLTPAERASLNSDEGNRAYVVEKSVSTKTERPTIVTALCGYFFVSWVLSIINTAGIMFTYPDAKVSFNLSGFSLTGIFAAIFSLLVIVSILGYWFMKKWSVYLYCALVVISIIITLFTFKAVTFFFVSSLLIPAAVVWVGFKNLDKMA